MKKMTKEEVWEREKQLMEFYRSRQRQMKMMFPSTLPNSRGQVSPLGGVAKPKEAKRL